MKTLRQLVILLGALFCVACLAAKAAKGADPQPRLIPEAGAKPKGYVLVSTLQMFDTMDGKKNIIEWACYAHYDIDNDGDKPTSRRETWQVATLKRAPGVKHGLNLFDIGAQHRTAVVHIRLVTKDPDARIVKVKDPGGDNAADQPEFDSQSRFYKILGAEPKGCLLKNKYMVRSSDPELRLEVYYDAHQPAFMQAEDGGPPSIPPVNEN